MKQELYEKWQGGDIHCRGRPLPLALDIAFVLTILRKEPLILTPSPLIIFEIA